MTDEQGTNTLAAGEPTIETRTSVYTLRGDGIIVQRLRDGAKQTLADARENVAAFAALCDGHKHVCLVDGRGALTAEPGVREYYAGPEAAQHATALALLVGSASMKVIANLFLSFNKPRVPTRMFTSERDAVAWLRRMQELSARRSG